MKKYWISLSVLIGILLCSCVICYASSTSESLLESVAEMRGQEKYLETAHAPSDNTADNDHVDTSTGNVVLSETDLYLPGRNGMDVSIKRNFSSYDADWDYDYLPDSYSNSLGNMFMYRYEDDDGDYIWVAFQSEEKFLSQDTVIEYQEISADYYDFYSDVYGNVRGYICSRLTKTNADATLTLVEPIVSDECFVSEDGEGLLSHWDWVYKEEDMMHYNWYFNTPYVETTQLTYGKYDDSQGYYYHSRTYLKLYDGNTQTDMKYYMQYRKIDGEWIVEDIAIQRIYNQNAHYRMRAITEDEEAMLTQKLGNDFSITCCIVLEREDGMRYFLNNAHAVCKIIVVADRFGNAIDYSTNNEIIDSMGRRIVYNDDGIQMEDTNGDLQYVVKYTADVIDDTQNPSFYVNKTYQLTVERFKQLGDTQTDDVTIYKMKKHGRPMPTNTWTSYYYTIESIVYPTGAHRDYTYQRYLISEPYFGQYSTGSLYKSKATSSKLYSADDTNYQYHYEYVLNKPYEGDFYHNSRKASMYFTMQKIRKAPDSSDDITTTYTYDYLGRIQTTVSKKGTTTVYPSYEYEYEYESESPADPPLQIMTTLSNGVVKTDKYEYNYNVATPDVVTENGTTIKNVLDYSYDDSFESYSLPIRITYSDEGAEVATKTVVNTLSDDKKTILSTVTNGVNGVESKTNYEYHTDGTVSKMRVYSDIANNTYTETEYTYNYNTNGSYSVTTTINGVKDADGANSHNISTTVSYDRFGNLVSATDAKGIKVIYTYDLSGRLLSEKIFDNNNVQLSQKIYTHDVTNNIVDITRENGRQEKQIFDTFGNLITSQVNYNGGYKNVYEYTYDTFGRPHSSTEIARYASDGTVEEKYTTTNTYDDSNRVIKQTTKNLAGRTVHEVSTEYGYVPSDEYIAMGKTVGSQYTIQRLTTDTSTSTAGYKSEFDAYGRKTADVILNGTTEYSRTEYTTDCLGNILTVKDDKARENNSSFSTQYTYDHAGRVLTTTDIFGNTATNTYNNAGQLITAREAAGKTITYGYDALGRVILTHDGTGYVRSYYDDNGNLVKEITGNSATATTGKTKTYTYDDLNRMTRSFTGTTTNISSTEGLHEVYTYDIMGNVLSVSQNEDGSNPTTYTYDILGRNLSVTTPNNGTESYVYNFDGTLATKTDKKGTVFTYSNYNVFKNVGRIDAVNGDVSQYQRFYYNNMNKLTQAYDSLSDIYSYSNYDFLGRQTESSRSNDMFTVVSYEYDSLGNKTSMSIGEYTPMGTVENFSTQTYSYDAKSRMTSTTSFGKTTEYSYNASDYLAGKSQGIIQLQRNYNNRGLVTREVYGNDFGYTSEYYYYAKSYQYDCYGEQTRETVNSIDYFTSLYYDNSYSYDGAGRLISVDFGNVEGCRNSIENYTFDNRSNITQIYMDQTDRGMEYTAEFPYTLSNHMSGTINLDILGTESQKSATSDANGNRITDRDATHTYDLFNRLTSYTKDGVTTTYTYLATGLRESKTTNNITTRYVWDGGNLIGEKSPDSCSCDTIYIYGADGLAYRRDSDGSIYQYLVNFRGDVIAVLDENQTRKAEYVFDPYGNVIEENISTGFADNFGYRGQYHDTESGYIYLRNRYLDPSTGRFITEDPIRDGLNWFAYCEGNPIKYTDLWGLKDVILSYIAQKNGGVATYNARRMETLSGAVYYEKSVTVSIRGITKTYSIGQRDSAVKIVNDKSVIDNEILMRDFGLGESSSLHKPGDKFDEEQHAAIAWGFMYNEDSINEKVEFGSTIYSKDGKYKYTPPVKGTKDKVTCPNAPYGTTLEATIHTHANYDENYNGEEFSGADRTVSFSKKAPIYLVTPGGKLKRFYDKDKTQDITINTQMPKDPNFQE